MDKNEIREQLFQLADEKYKSFHQNLVPQCDNLIGIRVPMLRKYAKDLLKENRVSDLLESIDNQYYEEIMLRGMLIGLQKKPQWNEVQKQIQQFVPQIDNWGICDTFCAGLKIAKSQKEEMYMLICHYVESEREFERRFAVVMLLDYYVEELYLQQLFAIFDNMNREGYYVQMAIAWAISVCFVKFYDETAEYMRACKLDDFTYNKALQKARESYRISVEQKEVLNKMKR